MIYISIVANCRYNVMYYDFGIVLQWEIVDLLFIDMHRNHITYTLRQVKIYCSKRCTLVFNLSLNTFKSGFRKKQKKSHTKFFQISIIYNCRYKFVTLYDFGNKYKFNTTIPTDNYSRSYSNHSYIIYLYYYTYVYTYNEQHNTHLMCS